MTPEGILAIAKEAGYELTDKQLGDSLTHPPGERKLLALAKKEGYKLSEADLEAVSGGSYWTDDEWLTGDVRNGIERSQVVSDYAEGKLDARDLDW